MISLVVLTITFFYLSKFEEEKTIFVSHNLLSLLHGLQKVINKNMFEWK